MDFKIQICFCNGGIVLGEEYIYGLDVCILEGFVVFSFSYSHNPVPVYLASLGGAH